ncbi:hypothetical protein V5E97_02130 [Singulisphaera sp. Ch08]|uniref:Uncharacterized protein n=1 Tax=Singulisphaera sp. Ch08 TaxID=3120278 RepID=A0AAU7CHX1_9BACT
MIGSIVGCEIGVFLALLTTLAQGETDPRKCTIRLVVLSIAFLALSILRRKALPAGEDSGLTS